MKKRLLATLASIALAVGLAVATTGVQPASACTLAPQAQTTATLGGTNNADSAQAQLPIGGPVYPYAPDWAFTTHWVGVQDDASHTLVQVGYNILAYSSGVPTYGFFYEFVGPGAIASTPITVGYSFSPGDMFLFKLWYNSTINSWGITIKDMTKDVGGDHTWSQYRSAGSGYSYYYVGQSPLVSTEMYYQCGYDLYDDGQQTVKQPAFHVQGTSWSTYHLFGDGYAINGHSDAYLGPDLVETAGGTDTNGYAYHNWKHFN